MTKEDALRRIAKRKILLEQEKACRVSGLREAAKACRREADFLVGLLTYSGFEELLSKSETTKS